VLFVCLLAFLHISFSAPQDGKITFCEVKNDVTRMKSLPQPAYDNYQKNHQTYLPITQYYVSDDDPTVFCISCDRNPPTCCHANCDPGYQWNSTYLNCTDINECANVTSPCQNGGTCFNEPGNYSCECPDGYTGKNCEVEIDECESDPCVHGECKSSPGSYTCICDPGYTGTYCQIEIDECDSNPCVEGDCVNRPGSYTCICDPGYTGIQCELFEDCNPDYNPCSGIQSDYISTIYLTDPNWGIVCYNYECTVLDCSSFAPGYVFVASAPDPPFIPPCFPPEFVSGVFDCGSSNPCDYIQTLAPSFTIYYLPSADPTGYIICGLESSPPTCETATCPAGETYNQNWRRRF